MQSGIGLKLAIGVGALMVIGSVMLLASVLVNPPASAPPRDRDLNANAPAPARVEAAPTHPRNEPLRVEDVDVVALEAQASVPVEAVTQASFVDGLFELERFRRPLATVARLVVDTRAREAAGEEVLWREVRDIARRVLPDVTRRLERAPFNMTARNEYREIAAALTRFTNGHTAPDVAALPGYLHLVDRDFVRDDFSFATVEVAPPDVAAETPAGPLSYRVVYPQGGRPASAGTVGELLRILAADIDIDAVDATWADLDVLLLPDDATYRMLRDDYSLAPTWSAGLYAPAIDLVIAPQESTLLHELVHAAIHRRCGTERVHRWFNEGVALYHEIHTGQRLAFSVEIEGEDVIAYARDRAENNALPDVSAFMRQAADDYYADPHTHYALAYAMTYFLRDVCVPGAADGDGGADGNTESDSDAPRDDTEADADGSTATDVDDATDAPNYAQYVGIYNAYLTADGSGPSQRLMFAFAEHDEVVFVRDFMAWLLGTAGGDADTFEDHPLDVPGANEFGTARTHSDVGDPRPRRAPTQLTELSSDFPADTDGAEVVPTTPTSTTIRFGGVDIGSITAPVWAQVWEVNGGHKGAAESTTYFPGPHDTQLLLERWATGHYDILVLDEPLSNEDIVLYELQLRRGISGGQAGRLFLSFYASTENPIEALSTDELLRLWRGDAAVWSEFQGGETELVTRAGFPEQTVVSWYAYRWWGLMTDKAFLECTTRDEFDATFPSEPGAFGWWLYDTREVEARRPLDVIVNDAVSGQPTRVSPLADAETARYPWEIPVYVYAFDDLEGSGKELFDQLISPSFQATTATMTRAIFPPYDPNAGAPPEEGEGEGGGD